MRHHKPTNAESIADIPSTHITAEYRAFLFTRAEHGEDVYAYGSIHSPTGIINVWDTDIRIPLYPLAQHRWNLVDATSNIDEHPTLWRLIFAPEQPGLGVRITVWIDRQIGDNTEAIYLARAGRRAQMIAHYINLYGDDPGKYHDCHF